jgi:hypothetical protein
MRDPLSEAEGCELLSRLFRDGGLAIRRNVTFDEFGVKFRIDGWDSKARVGFEFLSSEAEDHDDLTLGEFKRLMAAQQRGDLAIFVVDEVEQLTAAGLMAAAREFLDDVAARRPRRRAVTRRRAAPPATRKKTVSARPTTRRKRR